MADLVLDITAQQSDDGEKITIKDTSNWDEATEDVTDITDVRISLEKYDYNTNSYISYGEVVISPLTVSSQSDLEFYITSDGSNLQIESKSGVSDTFDSKEYTKEIIEDGIWKIRYTNDVDDSDFTDSIDYSDFLFHYNYENKLSVYETFTDLPDSFSADEIIYNNDVESSLLKSAFLTALNYSAEFGQLEIIEKLDKLLTDLNTDD